MFILNAFQYMSVPTLTVGIFNFISDCCWVVPLRVTPFFGLLSYKYIMAEILLKDLRYTLSPNLESDHGEKGLRHFI